MTSSIIRDSFRLENLRKFINSLSGTDTLYVGIGRPQYWDVATVPNNDAVELESNLFKAKNSLLSENYDREDLMSAKRVSSSDVAFGIFKESWTAGKIYDIFRHDWDGTIKSAYDNTYPASLSKAKYVVINQEYDIYICLKQGKTGLTINPSIYSPETGIEIGTNTGIYKTADGYYWKFIAKTDGADISQFSSITHHPVKTLTVQPQVNSVYYNQWVSQVNSANFKAGIYTINVNSIGSGYNSGNAGVLTVADVETNANFKVIGNGTGLELVVTYGSGGSILDVEVTNPGRGYTFASVSATGGTGASFDIIFTPSYGLGCDPVKDVSALYLLCNISLQSDEGGKFTIENDYRKICLISNPTNYSSPILATATDTSFMTTLNVSNVVGGSNAFSADEIIVGSSSGAKARIVDYDNVSAIRVIRTSTENLNSIGANNQFLVGETLTVLGGANSGIVSSITVPDVDNQSGNVIYSEYRGAILRQTGQTENVKIVVEF